MSAATILTCPERRRRWTTAEKLRLVEESLNAGLSVAEFARQRDMHPQSDPSLAPPGAHWRAGGRGIGDEGALRAGGDRACRHAGERGRDGGAAMIEVVLRNGRVLRLWESVAPDGAARFADALENCR